MRWALLSMCVMANCVGCWGPSTDQEAVTGTVTLNGAPLKSGVITFIPVAGGRSAGGRIEAGEFLIAQPDGPEPGLYRVSISAHEATGKKLENPSNPGEFADELQQIVPRRYNSQTELTAEVQADGNNFFEFSLRGAGSPTIR